MKPEPAPHVPGKTDAERMSNALRTVLKVSKAELLKREVEWQKAHPKKKRAKKAA